MRDLHAGAGVFASRPLPVPIYTNVQSPTHERRNRDGRVGVLVHRVIGEVVDSARALPVTDALRMVGDTVERTVPATRGSAAIRLRVQSHAARYVTHFMPGHECTFLGAEVRVERGRVDLAWSHPDHGVWFDEVKTWRHAGMSWDAQTWDQVDRYMKAGTAQFGARFAGVRLVVTGHTQDSVVIGPDGLVTPLMSSPLAPAVASTVGAA
ncbi:hypothetical protein [Phycicoccus duodecadis]|uniref:PD-(D/E)XK nuclease superfamily protein n=1 Tax=Phycicoccus duodecadis TaxID=173053 RepID=A0A2N3YFW2_9MICO|nr:hypothetical protein [Phycicoccus duodecadis]PKW25747.1 hypothetical protein ATL31_0547 [Phycicoccus duodecadis]